MEEEANAAFDTDGIEKLFNKAKSSGGSYPFAFGLASKVEDCGFLVHLRKPGKLLKKEVKAAGKSIRKACFGTFTLDGGDVLLSTAKPVKGMIRQLRKRFREEGLFKYNPVLVGPDGAVIDEDSLPDDEVEDEDEDEGADEGAEAEGADAEAPDAADQGPDPAALRDRLVALRPRLDALPPDRAGPIVAAFTKAVGQLKQGDAAGAAATLDLLERALDRLSAATPPAPPQPGSVPPEAAARLATALGTLVPRIRALPPGPAQQAAALRAREVQGLIAAGDAAGAAAAIKALAAAIAAAEQESSAAGKVPPIEIWVAAKEKVDAGISRLQAALRRLKHPDTDRIAEFGLAGLSGGSVQTSLMTALMTFGNAPAADRQKAAGAVRQAIGAYRGFLSGNRLVELCEKNPFGVPLDLRGTLGGALDRIEATLPV